MLIKYTGKYVKIYFIIKITCLCMPWKSMVMIEGSLLDHDATMC